MPSPQPTRDSSQNAAFVLFSAVTARPTRRVLTRKFEALFWSSSKELGKLLTLLTNDGTQWLFNLPGAVHFGGKWEAGVKSVNYNLRRVIGEKILHYKEINTLRSQIEAVLNFKPLRPLTEDPDDLEFLTPGSHQRFTSFYSLAFHVSAERFHSSRYRREISAVLVTAGTNPESPSRKGWAHSSSDYQNANINLPATDHKNKFSSMEKNIS